MLHLHLRAVLIGAASTLVLAASARAQEGRLIADGDTLACVPFESCDAADRVCVHAGDMCTDGMCTSAGSTDTPCCLAGEECESTGSPCVPVTSTWGYCMGTAPPPTTCPDYPLGACFARASWADGDCDGDGTLNRDENDGCVCRNADTTTAPGCMRPSIDAGAVDGGRVSPIRDGGANTGDSGEREPKRDAGSAGSLAAHGWDYRGSGGCTCDTANTGGDAVWLAIGLTVLLGARGRPRRSREPR